MDPGAGTILITGSSRGIGRETARLFLARGYSVVINGRDPRKLAETLSSLDDGRGRLLAVAGDMTSEADAAALVSRTAEAFGRLDILINNAGLSMRGSFQDTTAAVFRTMFEANLISAATATRAALPSLRQSKGSVVFVSSLAGVRGFPGIAAYSAAKMGLTAFADALRVELHGQGVAVGIVYVGFTENDPDKTVYRADGSRETISRSFSSTQAHVASALFRAAVGRQKRVYLTLYGPLLRFAQRFAPSLVEWALRRSAGKVTDMSR